jgi:hypothetical protein
MAKKDRTWMDSLEMKNAGHLNIATVRMEFLKNHLNKN